MAYIYGTTVNPKKKETGNEQNTTNSVVNNNTKTASDYYAGDTSDATDKVVEDATNNSGTGEDTYSWKDYSNIINTLTANPKAELNSAMRRAEAGASNYLKALGMYGSGAGASVYTDLGTQYMNANAQINANAEEQAKQSLQTQYENMVNSGASEEKLKVFRDYYGDYVNAQELESYSDSVNSSSVNEDDYLMQDSVLKQMANGKLENGNDTTYLSQAAQKKAKEIRDEAQKLYEAGDYTGYKKLISDNQEFLEDPTTLQDSANAKIGDQPYIFTPGKIEESITSGDLGSGLSQDSVVATSFTNRNGGVIYGTNIEGSRQQKYVNAVVEAAKDGKIPNGTAIDMNEGAGHSIYVYYNGKFYKATKDSEYNKNGQKKFLSSGDKTEWSQLGIERSWFK